MINKRTITASIFTIFSAIILVMLWNPLLNIQLSDEDVNNTLSNQAKITNEKQNTNQSDVVAAKETKTDMKEIARELKANELGKVPILVYHLIGDKEGRWTRTPDNFRADLQELFDKGYVLIGLNEYLNGTMRVPEGKSPVIITFDDSTAGHFRFIENDGEKIVDQNSAVGILRDFGNKHPEFGHVATFFINGKPFSQQKYWKEKLKLLDEWGFEIGNHTYGHEYLKDLSRDEIAKQIVMLQTEINEVLPDYKPQSFAIVQDGVPNPIDAVMSGEYEGKKYSHKGILWWAWKWAESPYHKDYDSTHIERIQVFDDNGKSSLTTWLDKLEDIRYISDGNGDVISVPKYLEDNIKDNLNKELNIYENESPGQALDASEARGVHVTFFYAASEDRWNNILELVEDANLSSVQLDIKDESGRIGHKSNVQMAKDTGSNLNILPTKRRLNQLKEMGIYSIARIVVFRDPYLASKRPELMVTKSNRYPLNGGNWVDIYSKEVWDYNIDLAIEAYELGFDEVQFDYNRFPEGASAASAVYNSKDNDTRNRADVIADFLKYARERIGWNRKLSATVFGFMGYAVDDQGIGQRPEKMAPYLDYLSPMIYPSHFGPGNYGFSNPNAHPYEIVNESIYDFKVLLENTKCKIRPWLQAFSWGYPSYNRSQIQAQIHATKNQNIKTWLLWNAGVNYDADEIRE